MGKCTYKLNIDGHYQEFGSEEELDSFLKSNKKSVVTSLLSNKVMFSTDKSKQEQSVDIVRAMGSKISMDEVQHRYFLNGGEELQSVTKFITTARIANGDREYRLIKEFNLANIVKIKTDELLAMRDVDGQPKYTVEQADAIIQEQKDKWEIQSMLGTSWHKVAQAFFNGEIETPADVKAMMPDANLSDYQAKRYVTELNILKKGLVERHGNDATYLTETPIYDNSGPTKIAGTVDLIVVDAKGDAHIYDYKTSTKSDSAWADAKVKGIKYQISFYRQILRRAGLNVKSMQYIPILLNDVDYDTKVIGDFQMQQQVPIHISDGEHIALNTAHFLPYTTLGNLEDVSSNNNIHEFLEKAFNYQQKNIKRGGKNVEEVYQQVVNTKSNDGKSYILRNVFTNIKTYIPVGTSETVIKEKVATYLKQLDDYNAKLPAELHDFVRYMKTAKATGVTVEMDKRWSNNADTIRKLTTLLYKYTEDSAWHPLESDLMYDMGVVAFENEFTHEIDFISLTANKLTDSLNLQRGKTLLGNSLVDARAIAEGAGDKLSVGDVELLKIYALVKNNKEVFQDKSIGKMYAVNMQANKVIPAIATQTFDALEAQWKLLMKHTPDFKLKSLDWDIKGVNSFDALLGYITDLFEDESFYLPSNTYNIKKQGLALKSLEAVSNDEKIKALGGLWNSIMKTIKDDVKSIKDDRKDVSQLLTLISESILQLDAKPLTVEEDMKKWGNFIGENMNLSTPERIRNVMARHAVNLVREALNNAGHAFNNEIEGFRKLHADFYKSRGASSFQIKSIGYNQALFRELIEPPVDGKSQFRFKNTTTDTSLNQDQKNYINGFLSRVNKIRERKIAEQYGHGSIEMQNFEEMDKWNIPLMKTSMFSAFLGKDTKEFFNDYFRQMMNPNNIYDQDTTSKQKLDHHREMYNQFDWMDLDPTARAEQIQNNASTAFEVDLEAVLAMYTMADVKEQEFNKVLPQINALKTLTILADRNYFTDNDVTYDFIDNFVGTTLFGKSLVAGESPKTAAVVKMVVDATSMAMLGVSPISAMTEWFTGIWATATRNVANRNQEWMFGTKEIAKAMPLVYIDSATNAKMSIENINFCDSVNEMFQVSEMDIRQLVAESQSTNTGIKNFKGKYMYGLSALPNYLHRMVFFNAQLIKDGVVKVNNFGKLTEESAMKMIGGKIAYNPLLDDRFSLYLKNKDLADTKQTKEWKESRAAYNNLVEQLANEPDGLKADGTPKRPYDNRYRDNLKSYADQVFGNYDGDSKAHFSKTAFGQIFTQFKNWAYAKKHRWYSETDSKGKQGRYVTEWVDGEAKHVWKGKVMEGIYQSFVGTLNDLRQNKNDIIKTWNEMTPQAKENFTWLISDLLLFGLLSLIASLWGSSINKDDNEVQYALMRPLNNSLQDLYIGSTVSAFAGTRNPIAIFGWSASVMNDTWGALTGDGKSLNHLPDNVGVWRTMSPLFSSNE